jgi:hypothetical protein
MQTFTDLKGSDLHWVQPNLLRHVYELRTTDGETAATLTRTGLLFEVDTVETMGRRWRIEHKGAFNRRFEIRADDADPGQPLYVFQHQDCRLTLPDGGHAVWRKTDKAQWRWLDDSGRLLMTLTSGDNERATARIRLELAQAEAGTRLLLALLGCYLILLYSDEIE